MMHIGKILQQKLKDDGKSVVWLARELGCHRTNVYNLFEKYSIDTLQLERICAIMHYNFFDLYREEVERRIKENRGKV
ncbi:MAG: XRE family transcriptional regulator [Prevotella sp.]|nr:XRE family transcriptional regulator [Prevotella sp.]MDE6150697.1 helix-turn-helix transcriptional regulator [Prevotella sp.]